MAEKLHYTQDEMKAITDERDEIRALSNRKSIEIDKHQEQIKGLTDQVHRIQSQLRDAEMRAQAHKELYKAGEEQIAGLHMHIRLLEDQLRVIRSVVQTKWTLKEAADEAG